MDKRFIEVSLNRLIESKVTILFVKNEIRWNEQLTVNDFQ